MLYLVFFTDTRISVCVKADYGMMLSYVNNFLLNSSDTVSSL